MNFSRSFRLILALAALAIYLPACLYFKATKPKPDMDVRFPTWQEAARAGGEVLKDFIAKGLVTPSDLIRDSIASALPVFRMPKAILDLNRVSNADSSTTIDKLVTTRDGYLVPLEVTSTPVTIVDLLEESPGQWRMRGINDQRISYALQEILPQIDRSAGTDITLYESPELYVHVYGVKDLTTGTEVLFSTFGSSDGHVHVMAQDALVDRLENLAIFHQKHH